MSVIFVLTIQPFSHCVSTGFGGWGVGATRVVTGGSRILFGPQGKNPQVSGVLFHARQPFVTDVLGHIVSPHAHDLAKRSFVLSALATLPLPHAHATTKVALATFLDSVEGSDRRM